MTQNTLATAPARLRPSAYFRGRGWPQLIKVPAPAAGASLTRVVPGDYWERLLSLAFTLTTSATVAARSIALNLLDGDGNIFNQTQIAAGIIAGSVSTQFGDLTTVSPIQGTESFTGEGSVSSPGASATICSLAALPAGTYIVNAVVNMAGTLVQATDANNIKIYNGGVLVYAALDNNIGSAPQNFGPFTITVPAGGSIILATVAAGTAASIYSGSLSAIPAVYQGSFQFPDILMQSGYQYQVAIGGIQAADQISNVLMMLERYPSSDTYIGPYGLAEELAAAIASVIG